MFDQDEGAQAILDLESVSIQDLVDGVYLIHGLLGEVNPDEDRTVFDLLSDNLGNLAEELGEVSDFEKNEGYPREPSSDLQQGDGTEGRWAEQQKDHRETRRLRISRWEW